MGFEPHHHQGYMGWFDLPGRQKEHIATIAPLDMVPAGVGWHFDPLCMEQRGEWRIGRGTDDDKGTNLATLNESFLVYVLAVFRLQGLTLAQLEGYAE